MHNSPSRYSRETKQHASTDETKLANHETYYKILLYETKTLGAEQ
jgi:hypothetical protein